MNRTFKKFKYFKNKKIKIKKIIMNIDSSLEKDLNTLISILLEEQTKKIKIPKNINSKFNLYLSLINIQIQNI